MDGSLRRDPRGAMLRRLELDRWLGIAWYPRPSSIDRDVPARPPDEPVARRGAAARIPATPRAADPPTRTQPASPRASTPPVAVPPSVSPDLPPDAPARLALVGSPVPDEPGARAALLARLAELASACVACPLARGRKQVVFGVGNPAARLVVVGEAPGFHEDQQGEPFVGPAGELLTRQLAAIHLSRADVYIANTVKCRPPDNRVPVPLERRACEPWLQRQLELIAPEVILAVGATAARALLGEDDSVALGRLRGRFHDLRGIPLMVTYHPAYLLRIERSNAGWRNTWMDLKLVRDRLGLKRPGDED